MLARRTLAEIWLSGAVALAIGCASAKHPDAGFSASASGTSGDASSVGASSGGTTSGATSGTSSGGTSSGGELSPFADGGFVFCATAASADAGPAHWLCPPGTYFCAEPGSCLQCRSDADCMDRSLPTYAPDRSHCDVDSGVVGYEGFCQECLVNADCAGEHVGTLCNLNPTYSPEAISPSIVTIGFETCGPEETDCRVAGGPVCRLFNATCNPSNGLCDPRSTRCQTDQDCAGLLEPWAAGEGSPYLLYSYCVNGSCSFCPGGVCPNSNFCFSDSDCGNPTSSPLGPSCQSNFECACTSSTQCGGAWPICEGLDAGWTNGAGEPIGICSCDNDAQCGDGGLACLPPQVFVRGIVDLTIGGNQAASNFCGVPCSSPLFPSCSEASGYSVCDTGSGLCEWCTTDEQCRASYGSGGPKCTTTLDVDELVGGCYCADDTDCPPEERCPGFGASCAPALSRCTPSACGNLLCDIDAGICGDLLEEEGRRECYANYNCGSSLCTASGSCVQCLDNTDCVNLGQTQSTLCCLEDPDCTTDEILSYTCASICHTDQDCLGNVLGPHCAADAGHNYTGSILQCGCFQDSECGANPYGPDCETDPDAGGLLNRCVCRSSGDCQAGARCVVQDGAKAGLCETCQTDVECPISAELQQSCVKRPGAKLGACEDFCFNDSECRSDFACDFLGTCRPRCDEGHRCELPYPSCDSANRFGLNGKAFQLGDAGGTIWCYGCLDSSQCGGLGCDAELHDCRPCQTPADCVAGTVCLPDGLCHSTCDAGACADGGTCDALDLAGNGPNICYPQCLTAEDCPYPQGCDHLTHFCGTCRGPTFDAATGVVGGPYDCPPDSVCTNFWNGEVGVCLPNCDSDPCPPELPICVQFPPLSTDHKYCVSCLQSSDCVDAGPGYWCDTSINRTFQCEPGLIE